MIEADYAKAIKLRSKPLMRPCSNKGRCRLRGGNCPESAGTQGKPGGLFRFRLALGHPGEHFPDELRYDLR
jgi:hypothetical protein